mgnify:CR=1 FL=1
MDDKTCKRCGLTKPYADFWLNKSAANGGNICKECKRLRDAAHRERNRQRYRDVHRDWRAANPDKVQARRRESDKRLRDAILNVYGPDCACCGESEPTFLTLDHINGGGSQHRKSIHGKVYAQLRREGFPDGYRVLCWNCNWAYRLMGDCPHRQAGGRELRLA